MKRVWKELKQDLKGDIHFTLKGTCLIGCLFLSCLFSCRSKADAYKKTAAIKPLLHNGDLIVRNGRDEVSEAARGFNRKDKTYSHAGIIEIEHDSIFVYHALGGIYNPSQKLMRQPLDGFCDPGDIDKFAIYRYRLSPLQLNKLSVIVKSYYNSRLPFDVFFNFYSNDKMYCSEFVYKSLARATNDSLNFLLHTSESPLYVSVDDLYLNSAVTKIAVVEYCNN